jgi:hypothetical protein
VNALSAASPAYGDLSVTRTALAGGLYTLLRRIVLSLPAADVKTTFVGNLVQVVLENGDANAAQENATDGEGNAKQMLAVGLLCNLLVLLDKDSPVFADVDANGGVLRRCGDMALRVARSTAGQRDAGASTADEYGPAQLMALLINKVLKPESFTHHLKTGAMTGLCLLLRPPRWSGMTK